MKSVARTPLHPFLFHNIATCVLGGYELIKENGIDTLSIPPVRLHENEEVNYEAATTAVKKAIRLFRAIQANDGHWPAEFSGPMFYTPPLVLGVYEWEGCNPLPPEFWIFPEALPFHPGT
ncbi:hypothetical protein L1987_06032 [Smallanthus sonchifolius]|uniref:Uncharacterized protein n=1 Tax=Smallanthus sonchifolius TaxID=185202 RepID=A0ACB9JXD8_9ASTR|nr:hypothetical protein L1987_06032 [Smallanthus sonchifolius]